MGTAWPRTDRRGATVASSLDLGDRPARNYRIERNRLPRGNLVRRVSVEFALAGPAACWPFVRAPAQEMSEGVMYRRIALEVTQ